MFALTGLHSAHLLHNSDGGSWPLLFVTNYSVSGTLPMSVFICEFILGAVVAALAVRRARAARLTV
jgi:hypothetical protein